MLELLNNSSCLAFLFCVETKGVSTLFELMLCLFGRFHVHSVNLKVNVEYMSGLGFTMKHLQYKSCFSCFDMFYSV